MSTKQTIEKRESPLTRTERTRPGETYTPAVDIVEFADALQLRADVPGAKADAIDVEYESGVLTIRARVEATADDRNYLLREFGVGDYVRSFEVGTGIDASQIRAEFSGGVLTLHLPKAAAARARRIAVKPAN